MFGLILINPMHIKGKIMTKKDYVLLASVIKRNQGYKVVDRIALDIADALQADNKRFNRVVFLKACGIGA